MNSNIFFEEMIYFGLILTIFIYIYILHILYIIEKLIGYQNTHLVWQLVHFLQV